MTELKPRILICPSESPDIRIRDISTDNMHVMIGLLEEAKSILIKYVESNRLDVRKNGT